MNDGMPFRFEAYYGSLGGPEDAPIKMRLLNERGLSYLMTSPGDLGFARAYVSGDLELDGVHPGNPYDAMVMMMSKLQFKVPPAADLLHLLRSLRLGNLTPPAPPAYDTLPSCRRARGGPAPDTHPCPGNTYIGTPLKR